MTLLRFIQVMNFCLVDPLLYFALYIIGNQVQIWTVDGHGTFQKANCLTVSVCRSTAC